MAMCRFPFIIRFKRVGMNNYVPVKYVSMIEKGIACEKSKKKKKEKVF
jgi:hypothetical protein